VMVAAAGQRLYLSPAYRESNPSLNLYSFVVKLDARPPSGGRH
jgi:hypothetical protein